MLLGDPRQSDQRTQSFHFPIVIHQSLDHAARSSAQAPSSLSLHALRALDRLKTRRRVGSTRRRGNHMHDHSRFQRDINDVTGISLSLSLYYSQKSLTHNIGSASTLPGYNKLLDFTSRCTHSLTSTLLTNEFSVLGQSNARTQSITRGQSFVSLSLLNVSHRSGTISPLFTCSLLWNSLRHPDADFSRFRNALATYMGFPVTRHT